MDGMPDVKTLRQMHYAAYRCTACGKLRKSQSTECPFCGSLEFESISLQAPEYCKAFGHNESEIPVPDTERSMKERIVRNGRRTVVSVMSREYLFCCARCGKQRTVRKKAEPH